MVMNKAIRTVLLAVAAGAFSISHAAGQSSNPAWLDELEVELAQSQECEVIELLEIREGQIGARNTYFAKVKCKDGREFDASRIEPQEQFSIRLCEVVSC